MLSGLTAISKRRTPSRVRHRGAAATGFTLVEILAVVVIIGIAAAVVIPQLGDRGDLKANAGARMVIADLLYAQNMAIATQGHYYVQFNRAGDSYTMYTDKPAAGKEAIHPLTKENYVVKLDTGGGSKTVGIQLHDTDTKFDGVDALFANCDTIMFDELGQPWAWHQTSGNEDLLASGKVVITCGPFKKTVSVERFTGEISVD